MPGLLSLANELICEISDQLDTRKSFRGTCRRINAVVSPRIFSKITIDIHGGRLGIGISQLEALTATSAGIAGHVRTIYIRRLAPDYNPNVYSSGYPVIVKPVAIGEPRNLRVDWAEGRMRKLLPEALSMLKGTTTVVWETCNRNPDWASILVSEFLETLPALDTLHLVESLGRPRLHLDRVANLTKLSVKSHPDAPLADIIANSPHLTHLDLRANMYKAADDTETLHELLRKVPLERPLRLEHLGIDNYYVRFDHETLPHLRHLRSVEFRSIPYISVGQRRRYSEELLSKSDKFGSPSSALWGAIGREGIPIEAVVALTDDAVIEYLALASGVKKISLRHANSNALANKFFMQVVPRHSATLVSLSISANFEGRWCLGQHNIDIFPECTRLAELSIAVDTSGAKQAILRDIVNPIMDMAARMPNLWRLELLSVSCEVVHRGCGNFMISHHRGTIRALCESITSFSPVPAIHPSLVLVGWTQALTTGRKFQPLHGVDGVVRYIQY